jgi:hypothetical protein
MLVDMFMVAERVQRLFRDNDVTTSGLFAPPAPMELATFLSHIQGIAGCDCVVRDMITIGHLGKFLSRFSLLEESIPNQIRFEILGISNPLFDAASLEDRSQVGYSVPETEFVSWDPKSIKSLTQIVSRETSILGSVSIPPRAKHNEPAHNHHKSLGQIVGRLFKKLLKGD